MLFRCTSICLSVSEHVAFQVLQNVKQQRVTVCYLHFSDMFRLLLGQAVVFGSITHQHIMYEWVTGLRFLWLWRAFNKVLARKNELFITSVLTIGFQSTVSGFPTYGEVKAPIRGVKEFLSFNPTSRDICQTITGWKFLLTAALPWFLCWKHIIQCWQCCVECVGIQLSHPLLKFLPGVKGYRWACDRWRRHLSAAVPQKQK